MGRDNFKAKQRQNIDFQIVRNQKFKITLMFLFGNWKEVLGNGILGMM